MNWEAGRPTCSVTGRLAWTLSRVDPRRQLAASSTWFLGISGKAGGQHSHLNWLSCLSDECARGVLQKGLASLPAARCDFQDWEGLLHSPLLEFHCSVRDGAQGGWTGSHRTPVAAAVASARGARFCVFLWLWLSPCWPFSTRLALEASGCQTPGGGCVASGLLLFAHSSWKWAQSEGSFRPLGQDFRSHGSSPTFPCRLSARTH